MTNATNAIASLNVIDYNYLTQAINNAALSRRASLQIEIAVGLIHFTQEQGGTDTYGKANLKAIYHAASYQCMEKKDRDYKTVNRRLNASAKLFDKLGSSLVNTWVQDHGDTESVLQYVVAELEPYQFHTMDDVLDYVGVDTNRARKPRQPSGPVVVTKGGDEASAAPAPDAAPEQDKAEFDADAAYAAIVAHMDADAIRAFCTRLLINVAQIESAAETQVLAA